jgi:hypothetical protein
MLADLSITSSTMAPLGWAVRSSNWQDWSVSPWISGHAGASSAGAFIVGVDESMSCAPLSGLSPSSSSSSSSFSKRLQLAAKPTNKGASHKSLKVVFMMMPR